MSLMSSAAKSSFRKLFRASALAFKGDIPTLLAARDAIRKEFNTNQKLNDTEKIEKCIQHAEAVATLLRKNLVQGKKIGEVPAKDKDDKKAPLYKLQIHKETELGDNDDVLKGKTKRSATNLTDNNTTKCGGSAS